MDSSRPDLFNVFYSRLFLSLSFLFVVTVVSPFGIVSSAHAGEIYVVRGSRGVMTFTSRPPAAGASFSVLRSVPRAGSFSYYRGSRGGRRRAWAAKPVASAYDTIIQQKAAKYQLDPALVKAVVHVESYFKAHARSYKGAMGLMQLIPATARRFGVQNAYHPEQNVEGGTKYLQWLLERYSGNERLAVAAYNAGEGAVDQYAGIPPYSETQQYVTRVMKMRELYRCQDAKHPGCTSPVLLD